MSDESILERCFGLAGRTALITGASGGIGRELARGLAEAGVFVALSGRRADELESCRAKIEQRRGRAIVLPADLSEVSGCRGLISEARSALDGRIDILVNCAGMNRRKPVAEVSEEDYDTIMSVNLKSLFFLSQAVHPIMASQGGGKIIHVASLTSFIGLGNVSVYGAAKAAVAQLAKTQAVEWAADNIQVNCLAPGFIRTPLTEQSLWQDEKKRQWLLGRIPAGRGGRPDEMIAAVLLLAGPGSTYITGQTIVVDGGVMAGGSWE